MTTVAVVGLGYVGLPLAVRAAEVGHDVIGLDSDPLKVQTLLAGHSYVEDMTDERLRAVVEGGRLRPTQSTPSLGDPAEFDREFLGFDIGLISVPTPLVDGKPDLSYVEGAARTLGRRLRQDGVVVLESTSYPGTTEGLVADVLFEESGLRYGRDYHLGFSPERIDPGNAVHTFEKTPKLVAGTDPAALERILGFYDQLVERTVPMSSPRVAEFTKLFENIFVQVNVALVNELAVLAHELDIDLWEAIDGADSKPHGFLLHTPGPGVGGHCIPVDPGYFSWFTRERLGKSPRLSELAQEINDAMPGYVVDRAAELIGPQGLQGADVLVLGVSYKKETGDLRKSPAVEVVTLLGQRGAHVTVADPLVKRWDATPMISIDSVVDRAGDFTIVLVLTDHDRFDYEGIGAAARLVLDCRNRIAASGTVRIL